MSKDLALLPATELVHHFRRRILSPVEVTRAVLERIEAQDPALNAFCHLDPAGALAAARESEARWRRGEPKGLVDGVPTTIKDTYLANGWPTRRGSRTTPADGPWDEDAPATARLREHGAVLLGKTTTPEFGWKAVTDSPLTGITRNPWDPARTPGGSSGGAAAAAAAGMGALHLGGDGAGSIRIPAAFAGVYGLKPTFGRVPIYPQPVPGTITHPGPLTRTVTDAALMLTVIGRPDPRDWQTLPDDSRDWRIGLEAGVAGLRIAYSRTLGYAEVDPAVLEAIEVAVEALADQGAAVEPVDPGFASPRAAFDIYYFTRFTFMIDRMSDEQRALLDAGLLEMAEAGRRFTLDDLMVAEMTRAEVGRCMSRLHATYDLLVTPQMPLVAFAAGVDYPADAGMRHWLDWSPFTYPFNFTQQPAASVPCGLAHGLPVALQIVGPRHREDLVLRASRALEAARPFLLPPEPAAG